MLKTSNIKSMAQILRDMKNPPVKEDTDKDEPGTQGDKEEYQKKRKEIANKFGVESCSALKDEEKRKACYAALDAAHVSDDEEEDEDDDPVGKNEEVEIDEKFAGWIAMYGGKKLEIKKSEADGIWPAKQLAIKHFKVPKSKQGLLAIKPAHEEVEIDEHKMGASDTTDMYALMVKGMKQVPGSPKQKETIKQINVIRKRLGMKPMAEEIKEASEWEEVFGDKTYQDSYWGDPATIRGKIEIARKKVEAKKKEEDEEQDHKIHQQRTNESNKKSYDQFIKEARGSTAVFTFGRFNPPTIGHEKLLNVVASTASKVRGDQYVFSSHSQDAKKNPLTNDQKVVFMKMMFPKHRRSIMKTDVRTAFEAVSELHDMKKYSKIVMVVGSDRVREFNTVLNKYNDVEGRHGYYRFDDIDVISAGERDPDSDGVSGMSASKMRAAVAEGDYDSFKMGVPPTVSEKDCHTLYKAVSKGMRIKEERIREEWELDELEEAPKPAKSKPPSKGLSPAQRRRMALRMKIQAKKPSFIMKRLRSMKRAATKAKLLMRARKAAIAKVVAKFYPKLKTKKRSELSYAERGKISDIVKKKKSVIARFAKRMVKDKRKQDVERRKSMNKPKDK